ncbi:hypothetical protein V8G54_015089, partial [Vigna mungo]
TAQQINHASIVFNPRVDSPSMLHGCKNLAPFIHKPCMATSTKNSDEGDFIRTYSIYSHTVTKHSFKRIKGFLPQSLFRKSHDHASPRHSAFPRHLDKQLISFVNDSTTSIHVYECIVQAH